MLYMLKIWRDFLPKIGMNMTIHMLYFQKLKSSLKLKIELINFWDMIDILDLNLNLLKAKYFFKC
jgi:hypothetical protein